MNIFDQCIPRDQAAKCARNVTVTSRWAGRKYLALFANRICALFSRGRGAQIKFKSADTKICIVKCFKARFLQHYLNTEKLWN